MRCLAVVSLLFILFSCKGQIKVTKPNLTGAGAGGSGVYTSGLIGNLGGTHYGQAFESGVLGALTGNEHNGTFAEDSKGGLYLCGDSSGDFLETSAGGSDIFVIHFNADGTRDWVRHYGVTTLPAATGSEVVKYCTSDANGNLLLIGDTTSTLSGTLDSRDIFTMKISRTDGAVLSTNQLGQSYSSNTTYDTAAHTSRVGDRIFLLGETNADYDGAGHGGGDDIFVHEFDLDGVRVATKQFSTNPAQGGLTTISDTPLGIAALSDGIAILGFSTQRFSSAAGTSATYFIARFDFSFNFQWGFSFENVDEPAGLGITSSNNIRPYMITADSSDHIFFSAYGQGSGVSRSIEDSVNQSVLIGSLTSAGAGRWGVQFGNTTAIPPIFEASANSNGSEAYVLLAADDGLYFAGHAQGDLFDISGNGTNTTIITGKLNKDTGVLDSL